MLCVVRGVEESKFCLFSVVFPVRCISSVSPWFYFRKHAFCFIPLVTILESPGHLYFHWYSFLSFFWVQYLWFHHFAIIHIFIVWLLTFWGGMSCFSYFLCYCTEICSSKVKSLVGHFNYLSFNCIILYVLVVQVVTVLVCHFSSLAW
jgi:hypothetical protein